MYGYKFITDLYCLIPGSKSAVSMFVDFDDAVVFSAVVVFLTLATIGLWRIRPRTMQQKHGVRPIAEKAGSG